MKRSTGFGGSRAFALPTVLIASVVMLIVLLSGLVAASSANSAIKAQYYNKLSSEATESGRAMVETCLARNNGVVTWRTPSAAADRTLTPRTDCTGVNRSGSSASDTYIADVTGARSTFTVGAVTTDANGIVTATIRGTVERVRTSSTATPYSIKNDESSIRVRINTWKDIVFIENAFSACALTYENVLYCWGQNASGQLGDGTTTPHSDARPVKDQATGRDTTLRFKTIHGVGPAGFCGITTNDDAYCWGNGANGKLGNGDAGNRLYPTRVANGQNTSGKWAQLAPMNYSSCGLGMGSTAGLIFCWGEQFGNQVFGNNTGAASYTPVQATGSNYTQVVGGSHHACGVAVNLVWCWGVRVWSNSPWYCRIPGEPNPVVGDCPAGRGPTDPTTTNTGIAVPSGAKLQSGSDEACLIYSNGNTYCFGGNFMGQAGIGTWGPYDFNGNNANLADISGGCVRNALNVCMQFKSLQHGPFGACGIDMNDEAWCWGLGQFNLHGEGVTYGNGTSAPPAGSAYSGHPSDGVHVTTSGSYPAIIATKAVKVNTTQKFRKITSTSWGWCGLNFTNQMYCWGRSADSVFGNGTSQYPIYYGVPTLAPNAMRTPPNSIIY